MWWNKFTLNQKFCILLCLSVILCRIFLFYDTSYGFDTHKIYFAGDSSCTCCREVLGGPDLCRYSLFSRLKASPPRGFTVLPDMDIPSEEPCSTSQPTISGYVGLKILDWNTACTDSSGNEICSWSCSECPQPPCQINKNHMPPQFQFG